MYKRQFYSWGDAPIRVVGVVEHLVRPSMQGGPSQREYSMVFPIRPSYDVGGNYVIRTSPERRDEVLKASVEPVSYTHLDVYKRQDYNRVVPNDVVMQLWLGFGFLLVCLLNTCLLYTSRCV